MAESAELDVKVEMNPRITLDIVADAEWLILLDLPILKKQNMQIFRLKAYDVGSHRST